MTAQKTPVAFISYSWTSPLHEQWVMDLATQLVEHGVEVRLDKWNLRPGHDPYKFMETMVADPEVTKVIVVSDKAYAEKANNRKGGVGTESQIMSPEIYKSAEQSKFAAVVSEVDENGEPYLPKFLGSRLFIDMSESHYSTNYEQLLRWLFDKPAFVKPAIGKPPAFLSETIVATPTRAKAQRAVESITSSARSASVSVNAYFETLAGTFEQFRIKAPHEDFGQAVLDSIDNFLPHRNEFIDVTRAAASAGDTELPKRLQRFFEEVIPYMSRPEHITSWHDTDYDNYLFIVHELFLYAVALLLRYERFGLLAELLSLRFCILRDEIHPDRTMHPFTVIRRHMKSLGPKQQQLRRVSLRADLLEQRSHSSGLKFSHVMQADFVLFIRGAVEPESRPWYPDTLMYANLRFRGPFEIFARAESQKYFVELAPVLNLWSKEEVKALCASYSEGGPNERWLPHWDYESLDIERLSNLKKLVTRP